MRLATSLLCIPALLAPLVHAQQASPAPAEPIATVATEGVTLHGALSVQDGRAGIGNNGEVTAGDKTADVALARGGDLKVCASTTVHLAKDASPRTGDKPNDAGLMLSLDRGAFETHYTPGAYSDVILTPDLRLLISAPGAANVKIRVNQQGDTCVDNPGDDAPYVIASSLMDGGAYRIRPNQRVLFVHGSLQEVVDNEQDPCGCPESAPVALASAKTGGPSSKPSDTEFPLAVSEGLRPPPVLSGPPVVPEGQAHAQVTATLSSSTPPVAPPSPPPSPPPAPALAPAPAQTKQGGFFHSIGHFFAHVFGAS